MYRYPPYFYNNYSAHNHQKKYKEEIIENNIEKEENKSLNYLNLFGFSISLDDLLIIALLFILYNENSENKELFFVLFLLLLS